MQEDSEKQESNKINSGDSNQNIIAYDKSDEEQNNGSIIWERLKGF